MLFVTGALWKTKEEGVNREGDTKHVGKTHFFERFMCKKKNAKEWINNIRSYCNYNTRKFFLR